MDRNTNKKGVIFNEDDVMSSFFFEVGLRVNANAIIHRMDTVMMEGVAGHVIMCSSGTAHLSTVLTRRRHNLRRS